MGQIYGDKLNIDSRAGQVVKQDGGFVGCRYETSLGEVLLFNFLAA